MALDPSTALPANQIDTVSDPVGYPLGKPTDVTDPNALDGTPWREDVISDIFGFQQALLAAAGLTASNAPDKVGASQYLDALTALFSSTAPRVFYFGGSVIATNSTGRVSPSTPYSGNVGGSGEGYQTSWDKIGGSTTSGWSTTLSNVVGNTGGTNVKLTQLSVNGDDLTSMGNGNDEDTWLGKITIDWENNTISGYMHCILGVDFQLSHFRFSGSPSSVVVNQTRGLPPTKIKPPTIVIDVANRRVLEFPEIHNFTTSDTLLDYEIVEHV